MAKLVSKVYGDALLEAAQDRCDAVLWMAEQLLAGGTEEKI